MREILFRGKRQNGVHKGEWVEGNLFIPDRLDTPTEICIGTSIIRITYDVIPETVGQYTGLTDKNGNKIFEGDILSVTVREYTRECGIRKFTGNTIKTVWSVEYAERRTQGNGFFVFGKDRRFSLGLTKSVIYNANPEVIGNIYDNPELLKGGEE